MAGSPLDSAALAQLFTDARTHYGWDATPVSDVASQP
jgi:3-hydroxypropanoate dehydrogenase